MSVVLVMGMSVFGAVPAYADTGDEAAPVPQLALTTEGADEGVADDQAPAAPPDERAVQARTALTTQDGEAQNYAIFYDDTGELVFFYGTPMGTAGTDYYEGYDTATYTKAGDRPWSSKAGNVKKVIFDPSVESHLAPVSTAYWFDSCYHCAAIENIAYLDTSNVTTMAHMFYEFGWAANDPIKVLDLSSFDTGKVTSMKGMFANDWRIESIVFGAHFDTSNVTDMSDMFLECGGFKSLDLSGFDTSNVTDMSGMFRGCSGLTAIDLSGFDTSNVTNLSDLFFNCTKLISVKFGNTFDTSKVTKMGGMFVGCRSLPSVTFPECFDTSNVTTMERMFDGCLALTDPGVSRFDTSKVTTFKSMFEGCGSLTALDVSNFSTESATNLSYMFAGPGGTGAYTFSHLKSITFGDQFTVKNATSLYGMFLYCYELESLDLSKWDTSKVTDMSYLFSHCYELTTLDLSSFDTSSVTRLSGMFNKCDKLASIKLGEGFSCTGKVISYDNYKALFPAAPTESPNNGLWWKDEGMSYTPAGIQNLTGADIAGTWTWSEGVAVLLDSGEGGTVTATPSNTGAEGDVVMLAATPVEGYEFTCWTLTSGEDTGTLTSRIANPTTFTLGPNNGAVTATFAKDGYTYAYTVGALSETSFTYNAQVQVPTFKVRDATTGLILTEGMDYTVSYKKGGTAVASPTVAGTYTVYVTGEGNYKDMPEQNAGTFTIGPSYTISGMLACESGWAPGSGTGYSTWGTLSVMRPVAGSDGEYELVSTIWPSATATGADGTKTATNAFSLDYVAPGSKIIFTPQAISACNTYTFTVPEDTTADLAGIELTAPYMQGVVCFSGLEYVAADRLYDPTTGADYTKDDDEATRTTSFALDKNNTRVKATDAAGREVPVYVFAGNGLVIQDDEANLVAGAKYTLEISVFDSVFRNSLAVFGANGDPAVTIKKEVTLAEVAPGRVGANDVAVKVYSRGRDVIHVANPGKTRVLLFLYDGEGKLAGKSKLSGDEGTAVSSLPLLDGVPYNRPGNETTLSLPFMDAGDYTLCAVESDAYGARAKTSGNEATAPATLAELEGLGFKKGQLAKQDFTVEDNKLVDVGVKDPFTLPTPSASSVIDSANSSVTVTRSYSNYATITVTAELLDNADTSALQADKTPTLRIYTNQKQVLSEKDGAELRMWPESLSINGKPVALSRFASDRGWKMIDGWIDLDLADLYPGYQGVESFPITITLTVPRTDFNRAYACAYLQLPSENRTDFIGVFDQTDGDISLAAPEVTAEKTFTAQGFTAASANVALYLDGVQVTTTQADPYGYYAAKVTLPDNAANSTIFDVQAVAAWNREGSAYTASSEVLDVTYSTTKASLSRLWMLYQEGQRGVWNYMLVYDNGEWTSMYKSYMVTSSNNYHRRYAWIAEFNNADYARNVQCVVPRSEGDLFIPMTRDFDEANAWLSLSHPGAEWYANTSLEAQGYVEPTDLDSLDLRGKLDYRTAASLITKSLESGNAFVSEPSVLSYTPSGVYVTYDDVERQTLPESEAYTGYAGLDAADVAAYVTAVNSSKNMNIVQKDPDANGNLVQVDPATAAAAYVGAASGCLDEWIAVALGVDADGNELGTPEWLQLHHTVVSEDLVDMSEPASLIAAAQGKYEEYLANIDAAIAAGGDAGDAVTRCPCKEVETGGIPIVSMFVTPDDEFDAVRFFIWAKDSNNNAFVRWMEKFDVEGSDAVVYRQYWVDEQQLVISEWNGQTGQKKVITYALANSYASGLRDTTPQTLASLWGYVGMQVQLGINDAADKLIADGTMTGDDMPVDSQYRLVTQDAGSTTLTPVRQQSFWDTLGDLFQSNSDWKKALLKKSGLDIDWDKMSDAELLSLYTFISDNAGKCFENKGYYVGASNKPELGRIWFDEMSVAAIRGGFKKVYEAYENATSTGKSLAQNGVAKTLEQAFKSACSEKSQEAFQKYSYYMGLGLSRNDISQYSDEYIRLIQGLIDFEEFQEANSLPKCIDWKSIPNDLYYELKYARKNGVEPKREQRAKSTGSVYPKGKYDPSGMVYEGMLSNPVKGATVTLYTYNGQGDPNMDYATVVDSELFGYEPNPQVTGEDGRYQWFVGEGWWQVKVTKDGYASVSTGDSGAYGIGATKDLDGDGTDDATTWWMPVLPEQIDVNIPLYSAAAPVVESAEGTTEGVLVTFSKPLKLDTVSADMFTLQWAESEDVLAPAAVEPVNADVAADGSLGADGKAQWLARTFLVKYPADTVLEAKAYEITVAFANAAGTAVSYAGTAAESGSLTSSFTIAGSIPAAESLALDKDSFTYDGTAKKPGLATAIVVDGVMLEEGTDYRVSYLDSEKKAIAASDIKASGTYYLHVEGTGNYLGSTDLPFTINKAASTIKLANQGKAYTGKQLAYTGAVTKTGSTGKVTYAYYSDSKCTKAVAPANVKKVGTYYVKATLAADANYAAATSAPAKFTIAKLTAKPKKASYVYNGKAKKPGVTVKFGSKTLKSANYAVTYAKGRKNVGTYKITVKLKGAYAGTASTSFKIVPAGTSISKVTPAKSAFTVKWKKQAKQTTGYQIQYATNKSFKSVKKVTVKGPQKVSKKISKLKPGKKYWVHVRTYKKVGKATYYSSWSKAKTVTTKK